MSSTHTVDGHALTLLRNGVEYFPRLITSIDNATHSIYLEVYIFAADTIGHMVSDALKRAAERGVNVHLLLDGFGCAKLPGEWVEELRSAKVDVLWYRPEVAPRKFRRNRFRRLHRKLVVIDGATAYVGGINIIDDVPGDGITVPRLDYAVEVHGAVVGNIYSSMQRLWMLVLWANLRRSPGRANLLSVQSGAKQGKVIFLRRDNLRHRREIEQAYLKAIASSQREIIIANAYFLPGLRLRNALLQSARRGVRVVLLLQGHVEYRLQHYATLAFYDELLRAGVEIHEYHVSYLHAKVAVVDGSWTTVGSSNIDPFSLWLAREANLVVYDTKFAESLRESLVRDMEQGANLVTQSARRKQGILIRLLELACYGLVRLLNGIIGSGRDF